MAIVFHFAADKFPALFYLGFPGIGASLMFTGGHGGTRTEDVLGLVAELSINTVIYSAVIWFLGTMANRFKK